MFNEQDTVKSAVSVFEWHGVIRHWKRAWRMLEKSPEAELFSCWFTGEVSGVAGCILG